MPCYTSLSSALESRALRPCPATVGSKWPRRLHTRSAPLQQLPIRHVEYRQKAPDEEAKRKRAIERLNRVIDPNDLSATLEAHRDSNRASIIRTVATRHADPDVLRPSFLKGRSRPKEKPDGPAKEVSLKEAEPALERPVVARNESLPLPALRTERLVGRQKRPTERETSRLVESRPLTKPLNKASSTPRLAQDMLSDMFSGREGFKPERGSRSPTTSPYQKSAGSRPARNTLSDTSTGRSKPGPARTPARSNVLDVARLDKKNGHPTEEQRRQFLREHENPLGPLQRKRTRTSYFDSIRRVRRILQVKQNNARTVGGLKIAPSGLVEYEGSRVPMRTSALDISVPEPWALHQVADGLSRRERFELEIEEFAKWVEPTPAEDAARAAVFQEVQNIIQKAVPGMQVEKFGSQATGLVMPMSDIDMRLFPGDFDMHLSRNPQLHAPEAKGFLYKMDAVQDALERDPDFDLVDKHHGRYPLLNATHRATGLSIQLVVSPDTSPSRDKIKQYLAEWPTLKPLYMVVKTIFDMHSLSDVWYGGFGSYSVFMMIVASLKLTDNTAPQDAISKQLLDFLRFYASLDTYTLGVGIEPPRFFKKKLYAATKQIEIAKTNTILQGQHRIQPPSYYQRYLLCLQDPADPCNDLGKKCFAIKDVQTTFQFLHDNLQASIEGNNDVFGQEPMLRQLVGRCDQLYDEHRIKLDMFGEQELEVDDEGQAGM